MHANNAWANSWENMPICKYLQSCILNTLLHRHLTSSTKHLPKHQHKLSWRKGHPTCRYRQDKYSDNDKSDQQVFISWYVTEVRKCLDSPRPINDCNQDKYLALRTTYHIASTHSKREQHKRRGYVKQVRNMHQLLLPTWKLTGYYNTLY